LTPKNIAPFCNKEFKQLTYQGRVKQINTWLSALYHKYSDVLNKFCIYHPLDHCKTLLSPQTSWFPSCPYPHWPNWRAEKTQLNYWISITYEMLLGEKKICKP